ncbi:glycosyl hydrolase family 38 [Tundrisphaera sp. TA3]|uniref:glycoside hydrolase family 38 N-terminal domain-containing protein n=1 Tax=Tundrisphaera sp. TA3 TaxID=3435775 RepID=UPI003EB83CB6
MESTELPSAVTESAPDARPLRFVVMIDGDGHEPAPEMTDQAATLAWAAASAPWHPALLAASDDLPRLEELAYPSDPSPGEVRIVAGHLGQLAPAYRDQAEENAVPLAEVLDGDRVALIASLLEQAGIPAPGVALDDPVALDFLALGSAQRWLRDLSVAMDHVDLLDRTSLAREIMGGARAWVAGDANGATNRLRAGFELLTQARERIFPTEAYILDLCLLDPATAPRALEDLLDARAPVTLVAPALAIDVLARREPDTIARVREAITEGWLDVAGGTWSEIDEPFAPWGSVLWQYDRGSQGYREHLEGRNVETFARRRYGLHDQIPQIARRFGLKYASYVALDSGKFPIPIESKRTWESPDGSALEAMTRPPIAADRPVEGARLAWRIGRSMREYQVAVIGLAHWPDQVAPWYRDFRRVAAYSPVLSRWVTANDFFHHSDRPYEVLTPKLDDLAPAYLAQAVAKGDPAPISARAEHHRRRARFDATAVFEALADAVLEGTRHPSPEPAADETPTPPTPGALEGLEEAVETSRPDVVAETLDVRYQTDAEDLARAIVGQAHQGPPGFVVLNPLGIARRVAVVLPDAASTLAPEGAIHAAQMTEDGVMAVVDVPPFGYAWVPREPSSARKPAGDPGVSVKDKVLRNESMAVLIDPATGGLRGVRGRTEETPRLAQKLAIAGLVGPDGKPAPSVMRGASVQVDYNGPALAQVTTTGTLHDPRDNRALASFRQRFRLWSGRPTLEIDITLSDLDPAWLERVAAADPWENYLACRWAWPDAGSTLRRTSLLAPHATEAERMETPDAIDLAIRGRRSTLLFGGLAHHRRHGPKMLDTLLIAGRESARTFRLGVALDLEHPFQPALDFIAPAPAVPSKSGLPRSGPSGWLFQVDHKSVAVLAVAFNPHSNEGKGWGVTVTLLETAGKPTRCRLRAYRDPAWAAHVDFQGEHIIDLFVEGDAIPVDLTPHELARVDVTLAWHRKDQISDTAD